MGCPGGRRSGGRLATAAPSRQGPDPINPIIDADVAGREARSTRARIKSHYLMFMLGASTWF